MRQQPEPEYVAAMAEFEVRKVRVEVQLRSEGLLGAALPPLRAVSQAGLAVAARYAVVRARVAVCTVRGPDTLRVADAILGAPQAPPGVLIALLGQILARVNALSQPSGQTRRLRRDLADELGVSPETRS
jgi:hypothetical protein